MTNPSPKSSKKPQDNLAQALRDNLHRRKAQARARARSDAAADEASEALGNEALGNDAAKKGSDDG